MRKLQTKLGTSKQCYVLKTSVCPEIDKVCRTDPNDSEQWSQANITSTRIETVKTLMTRKWFSQFPKMSNYTFNCVMCRKRLERMNVELIFPSIPVLEREMRWFQKCCPLCEIPWRGRRQERPGGYRLGQMVLVPLCSTGPPLDLTPHTHNGIKAGLDVRVKKRLMLWSRPDHAITTHTHIMVFPAR